VLHYSEFRGQNNAYSCPEGQLLLEATVLKVAWLKYYSCNDRSLHNIGN